MVFVRSFFFAFLASSCGLHAMHGNEEAWARDHLIKKNFIDKKCITPKEKFDEVNTSFKKLVDHYFYDDDLKYLYVKFLMHNNQAIWLNYLSELILFSEYSASQSTEFMDGLRNLTFDSGKSFPLQKYIDRIYDSITNFDQYTQRSLFKNTSELFDALQNSPQCANAALKVILIMLKEAGKENVSSKLVSELWTRKGKVPSSYLKQTYAFEKLKKHCYNEAIGLYESLLGSTLDSDNPYQTSVNYNALAICYFATAQAKPLKEGWMQVNYLSIDLEKLKKAKNLFELAEKVSTRLDPFLLTNLAFIYSYLKEYDKALDYFKIALDLPSQDLEFHKINLNSLKKSYETVLQLTGRTDELQNILCSKQEAVLKKLNKKRGYIKKAIMQAQLTSQTPVSKLVKKSALPKVKIEEKEETLTDGSFCCGDQPKKKEIPQIPKIKLKTRGIANPPKTSEQLAAQPQQNVQIVTIEDLLGRSSKPYKIFRKFFERYTAQITDKKIKISLDEVNTLMTALDQDFDRSQGKGSHSKVTLNFEKHGISMDEQMVILANHTYLIPAQIKNLRLRFIKYGLYPADVKDVLITKQLIESY